MGHTCKSSFQNYRIMSNSEHLAHRERLFKTLKVLKIYDVYNLKFMKFYYNLSYNKLPSYFNYYLEVINNAFHASMNFDR